jgi:pyruvate dehydrogenase E1 component beta subunit
LSTLRYDQAAAGALAAELQAGTRLVVLRPSGNLGGAEGQPGGPTTRTAGVDVATLVATAVGVGLNGVRPVVVLRVGLDPGELGSGELGTYGSWTIESVAAELAAAPSLASSGVTVIVTTWAPAAGAAGPSSAALAALLGVPGLKVAAPATAVDCYGLLRAALHDPGPVVVLQSFELADSVGEVADGAGAIPFGSAEIVRSGDRVTIVAARRMRPAALEAAELLAARWALQAEVIDPRCLVPFDDATVSASLQRTSRLLVVEDEPLAAIWGAATIARLAASHFADLDAPPRRIALEGSGSLSGATGAAAPESIAAAARELASW